MTAMIRIELSSSDSWCRRLGNFQPMQFVPPTNARSVVALSRIDAGRIGAVAAEAVVSSTRRASSRARHRHVAALGTHSRPSTWAMHLVTSVFGLLIAASLFWAPFASAQMGGGMGGMGGGHGGHGGQNNSSQSHNPSTNQAQHTPNPLRAMLTEARSLRTDLMLTASQIEPWSAMEDALRSCIELNRSRMPEPNTNSNLDPVIFAQDYADNERALSEASSKFADAMKAVMATLNPRQRQTSTQRFAAAIAGETAPSVSQ